MKKVISIMAIACCLLYSMVSLAQISYGNIEEKKTVVAETKIPVYDSLSDFKLESKFENYRQYIGFQFYLPKAISSNPKASPPLLYATYPKKTVLNVDEIRGAYFTLLDVIPPDYKSTYSACFVMKNDKNSDTLYWNPTKDGDFILVPYFVKQKRLFLNKSFVDITPTYRREDGGQILDEITLEKNRWTCKEVTLKTRTSLGFMKDGYGVDRYVICYVFVNSKNETTTKVKPHYSNEKAEKNEPFGNSFILEEEFVKKEEERKNKEQMTQSNRDTQHAKQQEKEKAQYQEWIKKYGQNNADLIVKHKVIIGMTQEMCIYSWGPLYKPTKIINDQGTLETWQYTAGILSFVNGILKEIIE